MLRNPGAGNQLAKPGLSLLLYGILTGLLLLTPSRASADIAPVGIISLNTDFPLTGEQEIDITNMTGPVDGCNSLYPSCTGLSLTDWTLTVNYTSTFYNQPGNPALATPYVLQWQSSADDIAPGAPLTVDLDLCGSLDVFSCPTPTTTVTSIVFTGEINPVNFPLFDPTADGGLGGPGATFFSDGTFSAVLTPSLAFPSDFFESQDITVSSLGVSPTPEPTSVWLLGALLLVLGIFVIRKRRAGVDTH